jgi:ABC-type Fe3+-hydroxamate transport system substrate-binding protein
MGFFFPPHETAKLQKTVAKLLEIMRRLQDLDPEAYIPQFLYLLMIGEGEKTAWMKYKTIKAVQRQRIYIVDPYRFCSPTPLSFIESVQELARLFHDGV